MHWHTGVMSEYPYEFRCNDKVFTDWLYSKSRQATQRHVFVRLCERVAIEHLLSPTCHLISPTGSGHLSNLVD